MPNVTMPRRGCQGAVRPRSDPRRSAAPGWLPLARWRPVGDRGAGAGATHRLARSRAGGSAPASTKRCVTIPRMVGAPRVAVIGLDGVDTETLRRYIAEGRLPSLAAALRRGREVETRTLGDRFVTAVWPTFASGLEVGGHGAYTFRPVRPGT